MAIALITAKEDLQDAIISAVVYSGLHWHGGHTTETLIQELRMMGVVWAWDNKAIRLFIAYMLQQGTLEMTSSGVLTLPAESPDPRIERFHGAWFVTGEDKILGPFTTEGEALRHVLSNVCSDAEKPLEREQKRK